MKKFEKISENTLWEGKVLSVVEKTFSKTFEKDGEEHTEQFSREMAKSANVVHVLPISKKNTVFAIKEFRTSAEKEIIGFPAGKIDEGETPDDAVKREIEEEIGKKVIDIVPLALGLHTSMGISGEIGYYYLALVDDFDENERTRFPDDGEDIEVLEFSLDELGSRFHHELSQGGSVGLKTMFMWTTFLLMQIPN